MPIYTKTVILDPVTGNDYLNEMRMYGRYHKLTFAQCELVMKAGSYSERDAIFNQILRENYVPTPA